jgi:AcrR family transcriptional regulator
MDETDERTGLPASIEAAWGRGERPRRGPRPGLTVARIVEAAIAVADRDGLAAVSMSRVARELDTAAMSLYRYVGAKDELLTLMVDVAHGLPPAPLPGETWRAGLERWAWGFLAALRRHPWTLSIPISGPPTTPNVVEWMEDALRSMRDTGLRAAEKMSVLLMLSGYVRNDATLNAGLFAAMEAAGTSHQDLMVSYSRQLRILIQRERFPHLSAVLDSGVIDRADGPDDEFTFGLGRLLDGVEVLVRDRGGR